MSSYSKFTYKWQFQPYKAWKGPSRVEAVPGNARPITNGSWILNQPDGQPDVDGNAFLPRPIKHWRRQLQSDPIRGGSRAKNIHEAFQPGATIYLGGKVGETNDCCDPENGTGYNIVANISTLKNNNFCSSGSCVYTLTAEDVENGWNGPIGKKICCNPEANVIKPATTILSKKYYTGTKAYLKSRCKLYDQKQTNNPIPGIQYYKEDGKLLYPNNSPTGPQNFLTQNCANNCSSSTQPITIYKPNNRPFKQQGATDSSNRTNKLRYDTVKTAGSSLATNFGQSAANAGSYLINYNTPYFVKSNYQTCKNNYYSRNGNHTKCFLTPTGNLNHTGQRITMITPRLYSQYSN